MIIWSYVIMNDLTGFFNEFFSIVYIHFCNIGLTIYEGC